METDVNIGVDIAKASLDVHCKETEEYSKFPNNLAGWKKAQSWITARRPARVVFEPTGTYHRGFERALAPTLPLVKVNPLQARRFAEASGSRSKTDKVDARLLAFMGARFELSPNVSTDDRIEILKELHSARTFLVKDQTRLKNRLEKTGLKVRIRQIKQSLIMVTKQISELDAEIRKIIDDKQERRRKYEIIRSIPGIGAVGASAMICYLPELGDLTGKQVASLAGVAPMTRESGNWKGRSMISGGRKNLRDALYMPAMVASQKNAAMKKRYRKMKDAGKPHKVAVVAIIRKMLELANTLVREDRTWAPNPPA